uniref:Transmembrane protein 254 n=1 Tax=Naja naja TaxID=35670 RepID=A0A8C6X419_NAJNA
MATPESNRCESWNTLLRSLSDAYKMGLLLFPLQCAVLAPSIIPYDGLGPLGRFTRYLQENHRTVFHGGYAVAWLIHVGEACLSICKKGITDSKTQLLWFVQTLFFGAASLYFLVAYKPPKKTK